MKLQIYFLARRPTSIAPQFCTSSSGPLFFTLPTALLARYWLRLGSTDPRASTLIETPRR